MSAMRKTAAVQKVYTQVRIKALRQGGGDISDVLLAQCTKNL